MSQGQIFLCVPVTFITITVTARIRTTTSQETRSMTSFVYLWRLWAALYPSWPARTEYFEYCR